MSFQYDLFVIGAGSAGVRMARWSASLGAKVGLCEEFRVGGTCVIRGCVPKKFMVYASHFYEEMEIMKGFGFMNSQTDFNWQVLKSNRDKEIERLSGIYSKLLEKVDFYNGKGKFIDPHTVKVGDEKITAKIIVIAVGSTPTFPQGVKGIEYALSSNDIFELKARPSSVLIIGGGYIAVEFAGIFNGLGSKTSMVIRKEQVLRGFDQDVRNYLQLEMQKKGIEFFCNRSLLEIKKTEFGNKVYFDDGQTLEVEQVICATGRHPNIEGLELERMGLELDRGRIKVDSQFQTTVPSIYAIGDCANQFNLTPVATREATLLAEFLFKDNHKKDQKIAMDYSYIPTAVFTSPPLAYVGLSESEAKKQYQDIEVYMTDFRPLKYALSDFKERTMMKMIVDKKTQRVLGLHMVGMDSPEIMQGFAVAIRSGALKSDFDATIGIHPSSAEEFVTMRTPVK